jgi:hypothetical protein
VVVLRAGATLALYIARDGVGYFSSRLIKWFYARKKYTIFYTEYDKDIE